VRDEKKVGEKKVKNLKEKNFEKNFEKKYDIKI